MNFGILESFFFKLDILSLSFEENLRERLLMLFINLFYWFLVYNLNQNIFEIVIDVCYNYPEYVKESVLTFTYWPAPNVRVFFGKTLFFISEDLGVCLMLNLLLSWVSQLVSKWLLINSISKTKFILFFLAHIIFWALIWNLIIVIFRVQSIIFYFILILIIFI